MSLREQFESTVIKRMKESGFLEVEIRVECLARSGDGYADGSVDAYWHFWQESRAGLVVELPETPNRGVGYGLFDAGKEACREAIEAAGVKVKP